MEYYQTLFIAILIASSCRCSISTPASCVDYLDANRCGKFFADRADAHWMDGQLIGNSSVETRQEAYDFCNSYGLVLKRGRYATSVIQNLDTSKKEVIAFWLNEGKVSYNQNKEKIADRSDVAGFPFCHVAAYSCVWAFKDQEICSGRQFCFGNRCFTASSNRMYRREADEFCSIVAEVKNEDLNEMEKLMTGYEGGFWLRPTRSDREPFKWSNDDLVTSVHREYSTNYPNLGVVFRSDWHAFYAVPNNYKALTICEVA